MLSRVDRTWEDRLAESMAGAGRAGRLFVTRQDDGWRLRPFVVRYRWFTLLVLAPTLLTAIYLYLFAANQYVSESKFLIRSAEAPVANTLVGAVLGGGSRPTAEETAGVQQYLLSTDAVQALDRKLDLKTIFKRPWLDLLGRLNGRPKAETLVAYYRRHVSVESDGSTGVMTLQVRAFTPQDSRRIADALLGQSEDLINRFNDRAQADALQVARAEVGRAEARVAQVHSDLSQFRDQEKSLDPARSSAMVTQVIGGIEGELAKAKADLAVQSTLLKPGNPQLVVLRSRVANLQQQVNAQNARLAGGAGSMAPTLTNYERLNLEREFADKEYTVAMASLENARVDAQKKHLYLVRIVQPNLPEKSLYPRRGLTVVTVFLSLLVAFGIGWLILAGIREHAA